MRKTSQDGGDSTSLTSGFENEIKRVGAGLIRTKKNSLKRKVQNFSHESDDGVGEPLLQKNKEKTESGNQSAKFLLSKTKTESISEEADDKDKLLGDSKMDMPSITNVPGITDNQTLANGTKSHTSSAPIHNHMNTNIFTSSDLVRTCTPKSEILVEIEGQKPKSYNPSPLIFTTAKIHADGKNKPMEPLQVTSVPIVSTIEGRVIKSGSVTERNTHSSFKKNNDMNNTDMKSGINSIVANVKDRPDAGSSSNSLVNCIPANSIMLNKNAISSIADSKSPITNKIIAPSTSASISLQPSLTKDQLIIDNVSSTQSQVKTDSVLPTVNSPNQTKSRDEKPGIPVFTSLSETREAVSTDNTVKPVQSSSTLKSIECNGKISTPLVVGAISRPVEMDINKNFQPVSCSGTERPSTSVETTMSGNKKGISVLSQQQKSSSLGSKQLTRQKSTAIEDKKTIADLKVEFKASDGAKIMLKEKKSDQLQNSKESLPGQSASNTVSSTKIPSSKITTVATTTSNSSLQNSGPSSVTTMSTSVKTEPAGIKCPNTIPSTAAKSSTVSTMKILSTAPTTANKPLNITKSDSQTTATSISKLGTSTTTSKSGSKLSSSSTVSPAISASSNDKSKHIVTSVIGTTNSSTPITKSVNSTTQSYTKTSTSNAKSIMTPATPGVGSGKPSTKTTAEITAPKSKDSSVTTAPQSKTSTVSTIKTSTTKVPTAKLPNSKSITSTSSSSTVTKPSSNKLPGPKATDPKKDDKSKA